MALTKEQILAADDMGLMEIKVPEWGGSVFCRVMSCGERDAYENDWVLNKNKGVENFRAKFLAKCLCDEKGELLFPGDAGVQALAKKSSKVLGRIWTKAMEHNALTDKDVEELAKN
jgi:hypothetical protein